MWSDGPRVRPLLYPLGVFVAWTLTSFLCHECAKFFLVSTEKDVRHVYTDTVSYLHIFSSCVLTSMQCIMCFATLRLSHVTSGHQVALLVITHVLSTLATNYSMTYIEASSVFAIKLLEPVTMAVAHYVIIEASLNVETVVSIPVIIAGTFIFTGTSSVESVGTSSMESAGTSSVESAHRYGVMLALTSNVLLTARNITLKQIQVKDTIVFNSPLYFTCLLLAQTGVLAMVAWIHADDAFPVSLTLVYGALVASGVCHVVYNYISTCVVLKVMNVVSHSVANIFKRLIVVLLLYGWGRRQATWFNFLGLLVATLGLAIYVRGKTRKPPHISSSATSEGIFLKNIQWLKSRKMFWMVMVCCCIVTTIMHTSMLSRPFIFKPETGTGEPEEFLSLRLLQRPLETNTRAVTLRKTHDLVNEIQRVLINLLTDVIGNASHVMLMEIATYENKGDPAITAGEVMLLRKMNKRIVYYCETFKCKRPEEMALARNISRRYDVTDLVILMQGGGNLVGYPFVDTVRESILNQFPTHRAILLSQSIWLHPGSEDSLANSSRIYSNRSSLYMFIRDRQSLEIARTHFHGVHLILAPDMAFGLGSMPRVMPPYYDILWLQRTDNETSHYALPTFPPHVSVMVSDWRREWTSNIGSRDLETSFIIAQSGLDFLQRGRVVVTDRLHGHILSTLMDIPHVLIDNPPYFKLSSFDRTWTAGLDNTRLVHDGQEALNEALLMLEKYNATLPIVGPIDMNAFPAITTTTRRTKVQFARKKH
ncbi:uncharacterized protein LOC131947843 [Physella acuta]|uniref:uncharacterized protein LOC131947843 n=1 Tax=Physella acuta TaxID=109671 RepID=UPI0027DD69B9|nr:uncharacterized protein LOC131947843 [Physella acuta]XP_059165186.1 uncharacterized protein LOC131947843 [Physella acuta]XP_059165187.1 uncharacterized protein LOC131947843 [Physella acuta]XP_059165188.1 uncharacterized protein LOC131947843 [Physella acuta]XP_059165189.1 uncharacterized protein LOC131947843 [Physella acuta]XP_059165190.1 uncharacterized protein LOC131947843 [Physella acuta]XP_059165191.1 uncharacterized protein LOC131947843 [Physella acuta]